MDKPSILCIVPLPPPVHGSAMVSRCIRESAWLDEAFRMDFVNLSTSRGMDEIGKRNPRKLIRFIGAYAQVFIKLLTRRYDLCYLAITCHGIGFLKDAPFVWLCKLFGRRVVIHQHNKGMARDVHRWPYRWLLPMTYRHTAVILLSWRLYPDVSQVVRREQVRICANGIGDSVNACMNKRVIQTTVGRRNLVYKNVDVTEIFRTESSTTRLRFAQNDKAEDGASIPRLLFLSNLLVNKGVYVLLDACRVLKEKGYAFECYLVGGETREITRARFGEEVRRRGLQDLVRYHGPRYGEDKIRFFREADLFVHPTLDDCFPLTILEAMSFGLPVVATSEGAIPDMVTDGVTGFLCERENVCSLVNAIEKLLNDKVLRKQMGDRACCRYKERYTLEAFEKNLRDVLSEYLN